ncbi:MAG: hypothetical protein E6Q76_14740 [Rhizobium sp.]|nr:MAG: hypothetical protein E6Q76_14740 [Rhizobium sp.]
MKPAPLSFRDTGLSQEQKVTTGVRCCIRLIGGQKMGRGILLWLLGIPLPIVILLVLFTR